MKKIIIVVAVFLLLVITTLIVAPIVFKPRILELIKKTANENLNAQVNFNNDIDLSLIKSFPNVSLSIQDIELIGVDTFQYDTLVAIKEFAATIDIMSLINGEQIVVRSILIDKPRINAIQLNENLANWLITKESSDTTTKTESVDTAGFDIKLKSFTVNNAQIKYTDHVSNTSAYLNDFTHKLTGDFSAESFLLQTENLCQELTVSAGGVSYLNKVKLRFDGEIDANTKEMIFKFAHNEFALNELLLAFDGSIGLKQEDVIIDLTYKLKSADFKQFISLIPGVYLNALDKINTSGELGFNGSIKGIYNTTQTPSFDFNLNVNNAKVKHSDQPMAIENISIQFAAFNKTTDLNNTEIKLSKLHFELNKDVFNASLFANNLIQDPYIDAKLNGTVNLTNLSKTLSLDPKLGLNGIIKTNFETKGNVSAYENQKYDKFSASGNLALTNFNYFMADGPYNVNIKSLITSFSTTAVILEKMDAVVGKSDFQISGKLSNFFPYLFANETIVGLLTIQSNLIDANQFISQSTEQEQTTNATDTSKLEAPIIPKNIDFSLTTKINELKYTNMNISDFVGKVSVKNGRLTFNKIDLNTLGSHINMNGYYESGENKPSTAIDFVIKDMDIQKAATTFNTVKSLAPIAEKMKGSFSTSFHLKTAFDNQLNPIFETTYAEGTLLVPNAQISNVKVFNKTAELLKYDKLRDPGISNVKIAFKVEKGRVFTKPFDLNIAGQKLTLEGSTGLDQTIDYKGLFALPKSAVDAAGNITNSLLNQLNTKAGTNIKANAPVNMKLNITGTFDNPIIKTNASEMARDEAKNVSDQLKLEADKKRKELEDRLKSEQEKLKNEAAKAKSDAEAKAKQEADRIKKEAEIKAKQEEERLKKKAEEEAKKKLKGIFK